MSDKNVFNESEIIQPMSKTEFDYKKHYPKLMENYCKALSIIESLERENAELRGRVGQKDRITKTTLSPDDYKIIKDDIEFEIRYHMQTNNPAHLDVCVENILNISAIYSEDK